MNAQQRPAEHCSADMIADIAVKHVTGTAQGVIWLARGWDRGPMRARPPLAGLPGPCLPSLLPVRRWLATPSTPPPDTRSSQLAWSIQRGGGLINGAGLRLDDTQTKPDPGPRPETESCRCCCRHFVGPLGAQACQVVLFSRGPYHAVARKPDSFAFGPAQCAQELKLESQRGSNVARRPRCLPGGAQVSTVADLALSGRFPTDTTNRNTEGSGGAPYRDLCTRAKPLSVKLTRLVSDPSGVATLFATAARARDRSLASRSETLRHGTH